jgi:hypothetical protein
MNKRLLSLAAAFGGLLAGGAINHTTSEEPAQMVTNKVEQGPQYVSRTFHTRKPAPAKPTSQPVPQQKVVVRQAPLASLGAVRFIERPGPRKVKYGKHRWVMVG